MICHPPPPQEPCFSEGCGFDGGDCFDSTKFPSTSPWANCSLETVCRLLYRDGHCDVQCNTPSCLFDGFDCSPPPQCVGGALCERGVGDGVCDPACSTLECPYDSLDCDKQNFVSMSLRVKIMQCYCTLHAIIVMICF